MSESKRRSKLLMILIALASSVALWLYVVTVVNPEDTQTIYNIPVTFEGEDVLMDDQNLMITDGGNSTVNLKFNGKRSELQKLDWENILITVDVSKITKAGTYRLNYSIDYLTDVNESNFNVVSRTPGNLSITVEQMVTKTIPVRGVFNGTVAEGYVAEEMTFNHDQLTIRGTQAAVSNVSYAQVILERDNVDKTITATQGYTLIGNDGEPANMENIIVDVTEIEVTLPIVKYKQIPLTVELIDGGGATSENVSYEISPPYITISGDAEVVDGINQINLGEIDLAQVEQDGTVEFPILIPNDSKNVSGDESATVTLHFKGLATRTIRVSSIEFINQPENLEPESMTQMLQATIRASEEDIDSISSNNVRAVADLSEYQQAGTYTVPVTIYVDGYPDAGAVGSYNIVLSLTEK
jgi:YbbR domain-containing protein